VTELRLQVLRLLEERKFAKGAGAGTIAELQEATGAPLKAILRSLDASETMGLVAIHRYSGAEPPDYLVVLKPTASIYLESQENANDR